MKIIIFSFLFTFGLITAHTLVAQENPAEDRKTRTDSDKKVELAPTSPLQGSEMEGKLTTREYFSIEKFPSVLNLDSVKQIIGHPQTIDGKDLEGSVHIRILVDENGKRADYKHVYSTHPALRAAVEKHIQKLTFSPAILDGKPIEFWINVSFHFELPNQKSSKD